MSKKRILLAFVLCSIFGILGIHRFYAGKFSTGILQILLFGVSMYLLPPSLILQLISAQTINVSALSSVLLPLILLLILAIWVTIDLLFVITGNFTDKKGNKIMQWI